MKWMGDTSVKILMDVKKRNINKQSGKEYFKLKNYSKDCYDKIMIETENACKLIVEIVLNASSFEPEEITDGSLFLPLFVFDRVKEAQGNLTKTQSGTVATAFKKVLYPFKRRDFISAIALNDNVSEFKDIMQISNRFAGSFWVQLFRAVYKTNSAEKLQKIINSINKMIRIFAENGNLKPIEIENILSEFIDDINTQYISCMNKSTDEIDWFGVIPAKERINDIYILYSSILWSIQKFRICRMKKSLCNLWINLCYILFVLLLKKCQQIKK